MTTRRKFTREFKLKAVELSYQRENMKELADELHVRAETLYRWRSEFAVMEGGGFFNSQMKFIPYNTNLKEFSRNLRSNQTLGETLLWIQLLRRQMRCYEFNRQKPLGNTL